MEQIHSQTKSAAACLQRADLLLSKGDLIEAEQHYRQAIALDPNLPQAFNNLGVLLHHRRLGDEALKCFQTASALNPRFADAHYNLGLILQEMGRHSSAVAAFRQVQLLTGILPNISNSLASSLIEIAAVDEAETVLQAALRKHPNDPMLCYSSGLVLLKREDFDRAAAWFRQAIEYRFEGVEARYQLAHALYRSGRFQEAVPELQAVLTQKPEWGEVHRNLADILWGLGRFEEAVASYRSASRLLYDDVDLRVALANALILLGRHEEAKTNLLTALRLNPSHAAAHLYLGMIHLAEGDYDRGWPEYDWIDRTGTIHQRNDWAPRWQGEPLHGKTILVHIEEVHGGGFGDAIQYVRYLPLVKACGGRVVFACQRELGSLLNNCPGIDDLLLLEGRTLPRNALSGYDFRINLMSLPVLFRTQDETIPSPAPYIPLDRTKVEAWKNRLAPWGGLRIGLVWAASDRGIRSCGLEGLIRIADIPGVTLFSLQKGISSLSAAPQDQIPPQGRFLIDLDAELNDFSDTAAAIQNLDLILCVDTAVAHLAGALGRPVWTLLPFGADWKWRHGRSDTPWYPTMRLFRQQDFNDWEAVFQEVEQSLRELVR